MIACGKNIVDQEEEADIFQIFVSDSGAGDPFSGHAQLVIKDMWLAR